MELIILPDEHLVKCETLFVISTEMYVYQNNFYL